MRRQSILSAVMRLLNARSGTARLMAMVALLLALWAGWQWQGRGGQHRAAAGEIVGTVVGISDGDTLTVLDADHQRYKVRLAFIDAPEKSQPYGMRAKQALSDLVYQQQVRVKVVEQDRYGRNVGQVWLGEQDVNFRQVQQGMAWHYQQYARKGQSGEDFSRYESAQSEAQGQGSGLWADRSAEPPWQYRRNQRDGAG